MGEDWWAPERRQIDFCVWVDGDCDNEWRVE